VFQTSIFDHRTIEIQRTAAISPSANLMASPDYSKSSSILITIHSASATAKYSLHLQSGGMDFVGAPNAFNSVTALFVSHDAHVIGLFKTEKVAIFSHLVDSGALIRVTNLIEFMAQHRRVFPLCLCPHMSFENRFHT
jgi:hypothetical protein